MSGPSLPAEKRSADMIGQSSQPDYPASIQNTTGTTVPAASANQMNAPTPPKQEKKDLEAMMFECSDLNAPVKAKTFKKPSVNEVQPRHVRAVSYQESQKACKWQSQSDELSDLFTLPTQEMAVAEPSSEKKENQTESTLPKWCQEDASVPPLYAMVLEASTRDGKIDTDLVYPILMQSGLPREVLGHIWGLANKKSPGQLIKEELYMILSLIALAQNNISVLTLEILMKCPQPLIPVLVPPSQPLSQSAPPPQPQPPASQAATDAPNQPTAMPTATSTGAVPQSSSSVPQFPAPVPQSPAAVSSASQHSVSMFPGLAASSQPGSVTSSGSSEPAKTFSGGHLGPPSGSFPVEVAMATHQTPSSGMTAGMSAPTISVPDDDFADFQQAAAPVQGFQAESFADFKSAESDMQKSKSESTLTGGSAALMGEEDRYAALKNIMGRDSQEDDFADFRSASDSESFHSSTTTDSRDLSSSVSSYHSVDHKTCQLEGATVTHGIIFRKITAGAIRKNSTDDTGSMRSDDKSLSPNSDDFGDFRSAGKFSPHSDKLSPNSDDFADFQQADAGVSKPPPAAPSEDKIAALKMLVQKADLYNKPINEEKGDETWTGFQDAAETTEAEEWADFESAPSSLQNSGTSAGIAAMKGGASEVSDVTMPAGAVPIAPLYGDSSAPAVLPTSQLGAHDPPSNYSHAKPTDSIKKTNDSTKTKSIFNHQPASFDSFGTFHSMEPPPLPVRDSNAGDDISLGFGSATTPGSDDFGDFSTPIPHTSSSQDIHSQSKTWKDASDSQSNSSLEFTGWKQQTKSNTNKEDSQSVSSLDFVAPKNKDSPAGMDSQSVSSLEFGTYESSKRTGSTPDQRSLSSLDLKTQSLSDHTPSSVQSPDDDFGDFSSANVQSAPQALPSASNNKPYVQNPIEASEVMSSGEVTMVGDRYSNIIPDIQDTDWHIACWQRCLQKCCEMIQQSSSTFNSISSSAVCTEVIQSEQGADYLRGIVEIYRVVRRICVSMKSTSVNSLKLNNIVNDIELSWANLTAFIATSPIMPTPGSLDFQKGALNADMDGAQQKACGVCLLNVDARSKSFDREEDVHKVLYSGRQYHASCANFWVNCIEPMLPALKLPELL